MAQGIPRNVGTELHAGAKYPKEPGSLRYFLLILIHFDSFFSSLVLEVRSGERQGKRPRRARVLIPVPPEPPSCASIVWIHNPEGPVGLAGHPLLSA